jgi:hypothetical protein
VTWYTHINRNVIDSNRKHGKADPPVKFQKGKYGKATYCFEVDLPAGSKLVYSTGDPILPCGARLVIISPEEPKIAS